MAPVLLARHDDRPSPRLLPSPPATTSSSPAHHRPPRSSAVAASAAATNTTATATAVVPSSPRPLLPWSVKHPRRAPSSSEPIMIYNNAVYYPNSRLREPGRTPASMPASAISHVFYAFARVDHDGTVQLGAPYEDDEMPVDGHQGGIRAVLALKAHNDRLKVVLSIGGDKAKASDAFAVVAASSARRLRCARSARSIVDHYGLDGIDIDWEHLYDQSHCNGYLMLLADLRQALPAPRYLLTSALGASDWSLRHLDLKAASHYLDLVNAITYDFSGPWSPVAGHASQTYPPAVVTDENAMQTTVMSALRYYIIHHGIPPAKINIGIPCYGRSFLGARRSGDAYTGRGGENGLFPYHELPRPGAVADYDNEAMAAYCVGGDGGFVTYDNPSSVAAKADLVKEHGLAGLFFWDAPADHDGCRSIVMAGYLQLSPGHAWSYALDA